MLTHNREAVERVNSYKYLMTTIDSELTLNNNTQTIFKKCQQWINLLRRLRCLDVAPPILCSFYMCYIESLLTFYESLSETNKAKLQKVITLRSKPVGDSIHNTSNCFQILTYGRIYSL